ncbi:SDR family NAD(P)-dependent oxidoreductase [Paenibacillus sp. NPDC057934]|uniref:SDR family NAD(P)-dependent oxidoreductase n=1 Tax=Paenibacillus sp. NPDC057934 TaxID=3346282 RepID=UPI0036DA3ED3
MMDGMKWSIDRVLHKIKGREITSEEGFELIKAIQRGDTPAVTNTNQNTTGQSLDYYTPVWEKRDTPTSVWPDRILLFDTTSDLMDKLKTIGVQTVLVQPGNTYKRHSVDQYTIDSGRQDDYKRLIASLLEDQSLPDCILHYWSRSSFTGDLAHLENQLGHGIFSLFYFYRALTDYKVKQQIKLLYLYDSHTHGQPQYGGVSAFAKTVRKENPGWICKTVELEGVAQEVAASLLSEFGTEDEEIELRYRGEQRFVRRMIPASMEKGPLPLRKGGTYLITGGLGGVGFTVASYLAKKTQGKIVLTGRSELTSDKRIKLLELEKMGCETLYIQADVSIREDVERLVAKTRQQCNEIYGIIHAAGVIRDAFLFNKTTEQMKEVIAPKVFGTLWLDEATCFDRLDFFIMFSSSTSVLGNAGQCDYAYANGFMDHYALWRDGLREQGEREGKSISINWPLWSDGGMKVDHATLTFMQNTMGILPISNEEGLLAFEEALSQQEKQWVVLKESDNKKVRLFDSSDELVAGSNSSAIVSINNENLHTHVSREVRQIASEVLAVPMDRIDMDVEKSEYGFDSISSTDFINRINKKFTIDLTPPVFYEYQDLGAFAKHLTENVDMYHFSDPRQSVVSHKAAPGELPEMAAFPREIESINDAGHPHKETSLPPEYEPVAIIGMAGILPGADHLEELWDNLLADKDAISEIPADRWSWKEYYGDPAKESNKTNIKWGGFIKEIDKFDALFFGISPREAELMDPRQRIFLETVWKSIEDAGYKPSSLSGTNTGLFVGVGTSDYYDLLHENHVEIEAYTSTGCFNSILTNRISYLLNLHGPSEPIDTACSSSLVAIHRAVESVRSGECNLAIAGGVNILASPNMYISLSKARMLAEDGRCKTFDKKANGYVRGEGSAAVLLKPLSQAERDGDHIYAIIRGSSVNHGGHANSLTAPNPNAQANLIATAWSKAGVDPSRVGYIEAHGSGTPLGDPIEINGLKKAFGKLYANHGKFVKEASCGIGTIKTQIGHLESAAGIAGLLKVLLCLKHGKLIKNLHFEEMNSYIELKGSPFYIIDETKEWNRPEPDAPRLAGVSSFGFGGVNAHIVVEEYMNSNRWIKSGEGPAMIVLSARDQTRLSLMARNLLGFLEKEDVALIHMAYTLHTGREAMDERIAFVARHVDEAKEKLNLFLQGETNIEDFYYGSTKKRGSLAEVLMEAEEGKAFINSLLNKRKLSQLAQLWSSGVEIDWERMYNGQQSNRLSLPSYPFTRESYWVDQAGRKAEANQFQWIHPLLHQNISDFTEMRFLSRFTGCERFFSDFRSNGIKTWFGAAYLEMAIIAISEMAGISDDKQIHIQLNSMHRGAALIVGDQPVEVFFGISREKNGYIQYEIYGEEDLHGECDVYCYGHVALVQDKTVGRVDLLSLKEDCEETDIPSDVFYKELSELGMVFEDHYRGVERIYAGHDKALAKLKLPESWEADRQEYVLHPCLADAALSVSYLWSMEKKGKVNEEFGPLSMEELEVLRPCTSSMWAHVRKIEGVASQTGELNRVDIDICDNDGNICISMRGVTI